jgi:hypothetical protein
MNVTEAVLENVTDFMTAVSSEDGNALTAILWILWCHHFAVVHGRICFWTLTGHFV